MLLNIILFVIAMAMLGWAIDERNRHAETRRELKGERGLTRSLEALNEQLRCRLEEAQARLLETGGLGSPGPSSERKRAQRR